MNKRTKISIIVPVYNVEEYLPRCLNSLINQTYKDIEIICINDGSQDNSMQILEDYRKKDNRIKIISQDNQGPSMARNAGIDKAEGEYILFIDSDDVLNTNACKILINEINKHKNIDIIWFQFTCIFNNGHKRYPRRLLIQQYDYNVYDNISGTFNLSNTIYAWDKLYNSEFIKNNKLYFPVNIKIFEDAVFITNCFLYNPYIIVLNKYLYNYSWRDNSITRIDTLKGLEENYKGFSELLALFTGKEDVFYNTIRAYAIDYYLKIILNGCSDLYFSQHKRKYLNIINETEQQLFSRNLDIDKKTLQGYQILLFNKKLEKYHLLWLYFKIFRPFGKYCIVLPLRAMNAYIEKYITNTGYLKYMRCNNAK